MGQLTSQTILAGYAQGAFPMADPDSGEIDFFTCDPRFVIPLDERFHVSKSLRRTVMSARFEIRRNTRFLDVVRRCARHRGGDNRNWISEELVQAYHLLHTEGHAYSFEAYREGALVGGLYGVALGRAFFGESMFSDPAAGGSDASKVCLVHLVHWLREKGFNLLDSQYHNPHLEQFGAHEMTAAEYERLLAEAVKDPRSL